MRRMPRDKNLDSTLALMRDPYRFISKRCRRFGSDVFETRLLLQPVVCMSGPEAAHLFYDPERFVRGGAMPGRIQRRCSARVEYRVWMTRRTGTESERSCR